MFVLQMRGRTESYNKELIENVERDLLIAKEDESEVGFAVSFSIFQCAYLRRLGSLEESDPELYFEGEGVN